jgi:hypothetical protein
MNFPATERARCGANNFARKQVCVQINLRRGSGPYREKQVFPNLTLLGQVCYVKQKHKQRCSLCFNIAPVCGLIL